ncbi:MAG: alpha/beta-type small acid-soluble spore protein [Defluviitaleaceae bacterium]|nr:alpha/beta-type small acid-soluble spore protein [Defluviitaleaceae bacterium]
MQNTNSSNNSNNSSSSNNYTSESMEKLKYETAAELGINLKEGSNGHLTTAQAGSIGGSMVRKMVQNYKNKQ